jgi:hypothetical protein
VIREYTPPIGWFGGSRKNKSRKISGLSRRAVLAWALLWAAASFSRGVGMATEVISPPKTAAETGAFLSERARGADIFVNSIGVNTHLNYFDRAYGNFELVKRELQSLGIRHLRDGVHLQNADYNQAVYGRWAELGKLGIRFDAVLDPRSNLCPLSAAKLAEVNQLAGGVIESFEGPNEMDISNLPDWASVDRSYQEEIHRTAKSADAGSFQVIGPSMASASNGPKVGNISAFMDYGNLHPYPSAQMPSIVFPGQPELARAISGDKQIVITESGYHNASNDHHDQPAVSEAAAAKYIPRLFLEDFSRGIARTYLYEFLDETLNPGLTDLQMHWGLVRSDGSEKPAFKAMKNLISELGDPAEAPSLQSLRYSLDGANGHLHHLLLEKANGEFDLILWQEIPSYDYRNQHDISNPPQSVVLTLDRRARNICVYEPVVQAKPIQVSSDVKTISLSVPDHPLVVAIALEAK